MTRSLFHATEIDTRASDAVVRERDRCAVIATPPNATESWGNALLVPDVPGAGERPGREGDDGEEPEHPRLLAAFAERRLVALRAQLRWPAIGQTSCANAR